jgi:nucleotide-binding universal stress UspA family protein
MSAIPQHSATAPSPPFERILCVTDDAPGGREAVRQAAALAGPEAAIDLVSVAPRRPPGAPRPQAEQIEALVRGTQLAEALRVRCSTHIVEANDEPTGVLQSCRDHDLVVVPAGESGLEVVSRAPVSVLVTRAPSTAPPFPDTVLVAVDATPEAGVAARVGAQIAVRGGAPIALVATPEHDASHQHALQAEVRAVEEITGTRPLVLDEHRGPVPSILGAASELEACLIVLGRRSGHPVTRVSTQVAASADCSVLVVRPGSPLSSPATSP